ncbi:MAG: hypothetical protein ABSA84_07700 [Gammaproteobacteria bacterium]
MQLPIWFKQRATWKNFSRCIMPLIFAVTNFCITNNSTPVGASVFITVTGSLGNLVGDFINTGIDIKGLFDKKLIALGTYAVCISSYLGLAVMRGYGSYNFSNLMLEGILGASSVLVPWVINNASNQIFNLSKGLLENDQEVLNRKTNLHSANTDLSEKLKLNLAKKVNIETNPESAAVVSPPLTPRYSNNLLKTPRASSEGITLEQQALDQQSDDEEPVNRPNRALFSAKAKLS